MATRLPGMCPLFVSREDPYTVKSRGNLRDRLPPIGFATGSALAEHLAWQSARLGRSLKPRIRLRGLDAICRMVECGMGIAVVPETAARRCRRTMALGTLRLTDIWATRQLIVCVRRLDALPAYARRLVEHMAGTASFGGPKRRDRVGNPGSHYSGLERNSLRIRTGNFCNLTGYLN